MVAATSLPVAWLRRRSMKHVAIAGVIAIVVLAGLAGALAQPHGTLTAAEAATLSIRALDARGVATVGTGLALTASGMVLTTDRVVEEADSIEASVSGRAGEVAASIVGLDPADDVAVIQLQGAAALPTMPLGDASRVAVGEQVSAISARDRGVVVEVQGSVESRASGAGVIVLSPTMRGLAPGAPVVDAGGSVVAMSVAVPAGAESESANADALLISDALGIAHDMVSGRPNANVLQGSSSVLGVAVDDGAAPTGARVLGVAAASPARAAGIVTGDVIEEIGMMRVRSAADVPEALRRYRPFDAVRVRWVNTSGRETTATVRIAGGTAR